MRDKEQKVVVAAFTEDQASRLTGVSLRQLRSWASEDFFVPGLAMRGEGEPSIRLYSFRDLVCLKIIGQLRNEVRVTLAHLREVKERLSHLGEDMWAKTTLYVLNRRIVFDNPETGIKEDAGNGQGVLQIPLRVVASDMRDAIAALRRRDAQSVGKIDTKRTGRNNPVVAGTRIPIRTIRAFAEAGYTVDQIIAEYPSLTTSDVEAALAFKEAA
jgi:uncharacterized protein (DUF433 family)